MSTTDQFHSESQPAEELQQIGNGLTDNFDNEGSDFSPSCNLFNTTEYDSKECDELCCTKGSHQSTNRLVLIKEV